MLFFTTLPVRGDDRTGNGKFLYWRLRIVAACAATSGMVKSWLFYETMLSALHYKFGLSEFS